ncbi:BLOC-3 complex member HPS4 isoform X2 [Amia ocellicauda]|uniref:BLOC-3 complex member HPS4 isoform X2 n=1 Tax=Amia ocellicauda TaxID=2972642 RepID=UPI003463CF0B
MGDTAATAEPRWCSVFFLYDGSKVKEEGDPTRAGICYFYPVETVLDQQEVLCGHLAGVCRCLAELSTAPPRLLRMRRRKFAIRLRGDFLWALGCAVDVPDVSVCRLLDQLIGLFCFYNGPVRRSYQEHSREELAVQWAQFLSHLQGGSSELQQIYGSLHTIDTTRIDPLLLLKAALILQACQRCPLVLAGCILYRGRVVSTQMPPGLTAKVLVRDSDPQSQDQVTLVNGEPTAPPAPTSRSVSMATVFLTSEELSSLQRLPVDWACRSHPTPQQASRNRKSRLLSRTLSDTLDPELSPPTCLSDPTPSPCSVHTPSPDPSLPNEVDALTPDSSTLRTPIGQLPLPSATPFCIGHTPPPSTHESCDPAMLNSPMLPPEGCGEGSAIREGGLGWDQEGDTEGERREGSFVILQDRRGQRGGSSGSQESTERGSGREGGCINASPEGSNRDSRCTVGGSEARGAEEEECPLLALQLYMHRVGGLVLALLVEPQFNSDTDAPQDVYHSSLASLNGLEAHLHAGGGSREMGPGTQGPYSFSHYDCLQNTLAGAGAWRCSGCAVRHRRPCSSSRGRQ